MDDASEQAPSLPSSSAQSEQAAPEPGPSAKPKGTGVFFGPALASRLAGSRSGRNSKQQPRHSQSFGGRASAPGSADAPQSPEGSRSLGLPARRASASLELSLSPTVAAGHHATPHGLAGRSSSFTAASGSGGSRNGFAPAGTSTAQFRSSGHSMPGGPAALTLYQLISSPHAGLQAPAGRASTPCDAATPGNNVPPPQRMHLLQQQQLQQQAMESDAVHLQQEIQQLQAQLQQLLLQQQQRQPQQQQQQVCSNHQTAGQQPLQLVNTVRSSTGGMGLLLPGDSSPSPDLLAQLHALQQPGQQLPGAGMGGGALSQQASAQRPFASLSCLPDASQQPGGLSVSALGGPMGTDLSTACGLPVLHNADLAAELAQAQQLQVQMPTLQEGPRGQIEEDDGQVAALDGMIDQCLSRLLQLRSQITARRAAAVPVGSSCSTPTATPAAAGAASAQGMLSSAGLTSDSLLQGVSQPLLLAQQVQQQHSGMLSPVSSMHGHMLAAQQQLNSSSSSSLLWGQQQPPPGPAAGNSTMLSTAMGPACQVLPQGSSCAVPGTYSPQPMPLLSHLQAQLTVLGQQQVLMQPADMQLTAFFGGGGGDGGRGSHGGNFSRTAGTCSMCWCRADLLLGLASCAQDSPIPWWWRHCRACLGCLCQCQSTSVRHLPLAVCCVLVLQVQTASRYCCSSRSGNNRRPCSSNSHKCSLTCSNSSSCSSCWRSRKWL